MTMCQKCKRVKATHFYADAKQVMGISKSKKLDKLCKVCAGKTKRFGGEGV